MTRTGYEVTLQDFMQLVSDPYCLPMVRPLLKQWFGYDIVQIGPTAKPGYRGETAIRDATGQEIDKEPLHEIIQADPEMQGLLYRTSQTLWR